MSNFEEEPQVEAVDPQRHSPSTAEKLDQVKEFMSRVVPWPREQSPGWVNLEYAFKPDKTTGRKFWSGKPFRDIGQFIATAAWATMQSNIGDVYYCMSVQRDVGTNKKGQPKTKRSIPGALALKAVWLDVDVKAPPKGYATFPEAAQAIARFCKDAGLPLPTATVKSGSGMHVYWISDTPLTPVEWKPFAMGLRVLAEKHGLRCDYGVTTDPARILRVPGTFNYKTEPPHAVELASLMPDDLPFATALAMLPAAANLNPAFTATVKAAGFDLSAFPAKPHDPTLTGKLSDGIAHEKPLNAEAVIMGCPFYKDAVDTGGKDHQQPLWNLAILGTTFMENGQKVAHDIGNKHPGYTKDSTNEMFTRKMREKNDRGLGWPNCATFEAEGSKLCGGCPHKGKIKTPLHLALPCQTNVTAPSAAPEFVNPYDDFFGPAFPLELLPPTLAKFVEAEHRAMGADPAALAMAVLTALAGAINAETSIRAGDGWWEQPILWTALIGPPSTMKSPIIAKSTKPLVDIDAQRQKAWQREYAAWQQTQKTKKTPPPPRLPRCVIKDATPEKVAEILARDPGGSLMVHDELAGWLDSFERYSSGQSSRAFYLTCWNGGPFTKDRVGKGARDLGAEIHVDNLALSALGGIQPDRLAQLRDLTSDGLLQRFLPVLMKPAERGDADHPVALAESNYGNLLKSINSASPGKYGFYDDTLEVRDHVLEHLRELELLDGFPPALIGAIGKLKGYFARVCLVLEIAKKHDPMYVPEGVSIPKSFTREHAAEIAKHRPPDFICDKLSDGIYSCTPISRRTAEAAEKLLNEFILPHMFGLYDILAAGGQDRDMLRSIADFILASKKDRLRPSDVTAGVRTLRGKPEKTINEWMGRFCAMGWLVPEESKPGVPPKAWKVVPGLREHFKERQQQAQVARAKAHEILRAGGTPRAR